MIKWDQTDEVLCSKHLTARLKASPLVELGSVV